MSFDPTCPHHLVPLPPAGIANADHLENLLKARVALAELKGASADIPNPLLLMGPIMVRESVASSNIENINTTLAEVLQWKLFPEAEQKQPDKEVLRYHEAMFWGFEQLKQLPISSRIILGIHSRLIPEGNGAYRREQNRIVNLSAREDLYTPPPAQDVTGLINNWENYVNDRDDPVDPLIRAIITHYQFEAIHPFRDGNGRTGRILMILQLIQSGLLDFPVLYISGFINAYREQYYKTLRGVTAENNWKLYIDFMLEGFELQARSTRLTLLKINRLFQMTRDIVKSKNSKVYSLDLIEAIFSTPVISPTALADRLGMHYTTASKHLAILVDMGILRDARVGKHHLFANYQLIDLLK